MMANFSAAIVFNYKDDVLIPMGQYLERKGLKSKIPYVHLQGETEMM